MGKWGMTGTENCEISVSVVKIEKFHFRRHINYFTRQFNRHLLFILLFTTTSPLTQTSCDNFYLFYDCCYEYYCISLTMAHLLKFGTKKSSAPRSLPGQGQKSANVRLQHSFSLTKTIIRRKMGYNEEISSVCKLEV